MLNHNNDDLRDRPRFRVVWMPREDVETQCIQEMRNLAIRNGISQETVREYFDDVCVGFPARGRGVVAAFKAKYRIA